MIDYITESEFHTRRKAYGWTSIPNGESKVVVDLDGEAFFCFLDEDPYSHIFYYVKCPDIHIAQDVIGKGRRQSNFKESVTLYNRKHKLELL